MAYLTDQLISDAYYLSGIVARSLQTVGGDQLTDGLVLLNSVLTDKSMDGSGIPYYSQTVVNCVVNQESYFVEGLIVEEELTFNYNTVRYSMVKVSREIYFGSARANNIASLPYTYHVERELGGSRIWVYFLPNQAFPLTITGKFSLTEVAADDDLDEILDKFYINYLKYAVADRICDFNGLPLPPNAAATLQKYESKLVNLSPPDLSIVKQSTLSSNSSVNWAEMNLGNGWVP